MQPIVQRMGVALAWLALSATALRAAEEWTPLFNGRNLDGWETWMAVPPADWTVPGMTRGADGQYTEPIGLNRDPLQVFTVEEVDGAPALHIGGQGFGPIATKATYANYHLRLQFKWGRQRFTPRATVVRDSGILYHVHGENGAHDGTWPASVELQIQEGDCGDLWTVSTRATVRARPKRGEAFAVYDPTQPELTVAGWHDANSSRCIKLADHEKPHGEWNTAEAIVLGDTAIHVVNGRVVLRLTGMQQRQGNAWVPLTAGRIALQTEGAEVFFRGVELREIAAVPAEYRE